MGTRADFYIGKGLDAEWLGSIGWDGYPSGIPDRIINATDEASYRAEVEDFIHNREDGTKPEQGWPWPWNDSKTTDWAYAFTTGRVEGCCFGEGWVIPDSDMDDPTEFISTEVEFPYMKNRQNIAWDHRSGLIVLQAKIK